jgi:hypothetical protein
MQPISFFYLMSNETGAKNYFSMGIQHFRIVSFGRTKLSSFDKHSKKASRSSKLWQRELHKGLFQHHVIT